MTERNCVSWRTNRPSLPTSSSAGSVSTHFPSTKPAMRALLSDAAKRLAAILPACGNAGRSRALIERPLQTTENTDVVPRQTDVQGHAPGKRTGSRRGARQGRETRSEEHTSELQSRENLVCR